jgi:hypothetical protein
MDASINVFMEPSCFLLEIIFQKKQRTIAMHAVFLYWVLTCIKTTVNFTYLGVDNTAPLGIIP